MITATTGTSAVNLKCGTGRTIHKVTGFFAKSLPEEVQQLFYQTNTIVIDEVSFLSQESLKIIHDQLCEVAPAHSCHQPYGGFNVIFTGDFGQLPPCSGTPIYQDYCLYWHGMLNSAIYLDGHHCFHQILSGGTFG